MNPDNFKLFKKELRGIFTNLLSNCYTDFEEIDIKDAKGQVFTLSIFYGEDYTNKDGEHLDNINIVRPILHFQALGQWTNSNFDINAFFTINGLIFSEFTELAERHQFDALIKPFQDAVNYVSPKDIGQHSVDSYFFVSLESNVCGSNLYQSDLLKESIAVIELNESTGSIEVNCTMSERKKVDVLIDNNPLMLLVPFDKVENLKQFQPKPEKDKIDERYIFVAMSFQNDPLLEDTYSTVKRATKNLKKGLRCERVDDINDDFIINEKIYECIKKSRLIIVDLTGNRPNVYYELGYARALGKQIILIAKEGEKPHFDVSHQNTIFYSNSTELEKKLNSRLRAIFQK